MKKGIKRISAGTFAKEGLLAALLLVGAALLSACGSSGSNSASGGAALGSTSTTQACSNCGSALVTLTDAPGDFLSYIVNVVALQLTRADGTSVQVVPTTAQVDFAQLVNLSEVISAADVPAGQYVSAALTLDYSAATIVVDSGSGSVTISPANIINGATSKPLVSPNTTQLTLTLSLASSNNLVITQHSVANLALDFNLAASNAVGPTLTAPTTVTVNPVLTASLVPDATKQIRVHGPFVSASTSASDFVIGVRPFANSSGTSSGQLTVDTTATTSYSINGTSYTGSAGLTQLATVAAGTVVAVYGSWDQTTQVFTAASLAAGTSVVGTKQDGVRGTVVSRTGNTVVVSGGAITHADTDDLGYAPSVTVTVGAATTVTEQGQTGTFTIADISVGQRVQLAGALTVTTTPATSTSPAVTTATLDATAGSVQLLPTKVSGTVTATSSGAVTLNLTALDGRLPSVFTFAGTGATSAQDASASAYTVAVPSALTTAGSLTNNTPVSFTGFVSPFGTAPPDFAALALVNFANTNAQLQLRWLTAGVTAPFATESSTALSMTQAMLATSAQHSIRIGFESIDPTTLTTGISLVPDAAASQPMFVIGHQKSWQEDTFTTFATFETALAADLNGTTALLLIAADGPYAATSGTLSVDRVVVLLND